MVWTRQRRRLPLLLVLCLASSCLSHHAPSPVVCRVDKDCAPREECLHARDSGVTVAVKTCQCHHYTFAWGTEPRCIDYNWVRGPSHLTDMLRTYWMATGMRQCAYRALVVVARVLLQRAISTALMAVGLMVILTLSHIQYMVAYREHMTDPPLRAVSAHV